MARYALLWIVSLLSVVNYRKDSNVEDAGSFRDLDPGTVDAITDPHSLSYSSFRPGVYGTFTEAFISPEKGGDSANTNRSTMESDGDMKKDLQKEQEEQEHSFKNFWPKMRQLIPFIYPKGNIWLQFLIAMTCFFLLLGRFVNVLVPIQTKRVISRLYTDDRKCLYSPWNQSSWRCHNNTVIANM